MPPESRYVIYGVTGSGKTTLAAAISARTGIPWHCMDDIAWEPGWVQVSPEEQRERAAPMIAGERWVMDTAYSSYRDLALARAHVLVALDYGRWLTLARLIRRTVRRVVDKRPVCNGNTETWRQTFSRDSIIVWHFRSYSRKRQQMREWAQHSPGPRVVHLTSPRGTEQWLQTVRRVES